ncbi:MAG: tagaturonate epimerase family protein [Christensenellales bacterium]
MAGYKLLLEQNATAAQMKELSADFETYGVYADSIQTAAGTVFFIARDKKEKVLIASGPSVVLDKLEGKEIKGLKDAKVCPLNLANNHVLREYFPYMVPVSYKGRDITFGLGDRLGLASAGHLRLLRHYRVFPVIAQQSMRELKLMGRTYGGVLMDASWAVFQENYMEGFGADGDHLKTADEVANALSCGFTMITLDCSENIDNDIYALSQDERKARYGKLDAKYRKSMEAKYLGQEIILKNGVKVPFDDKMYYQTLLVYGKAIDFAEEIYYKVVKKCGRHIDFEVSIDETLAETEPAAHYIVANELLERGVDIGSIAPRFVGEFQKGVDYMGNLGQFEVDFDIHERIADHFGYRISVHSGSDKFSVFPIVGERTGGRYHIKTSGTNWLEFVRLIALYAPELFRKIYNYAKTKFVEAGKLYHVSGKLENCPDVDALPDDELASLLDVEKVDTRQLMHITYGYILTVKDERGNYMFKDALYALGFEREEEYYKLLEQHIGRHVQELGIEKK